MFLDAIRTPRSQRVIIDIPIRVHVNREGAGSVEEITKTVLVNARGALIKLSTLVGVGESVRMVNVRNNAEIKCTVANIRTDPKDKERAEVGIVFDEPAPWYWGLSFPPEDWNLVARSNQQ